MVSVVVRDRKDGEGEENVLFLAPSVLAAVALVAAFDAAASDSTVSAVVESVGGRDLELVGPFAWLSCDAAGEYLLLDRELLRDLCEDSGVWKDRWPVLMASCLVGTQYGLFFSCPSFLLLLLMDRVLRLWVMPRVAESALEFLRLASRFIQFEKGRRRPWRSTTWSARRSKLVTACGSIYLKRPFRESCR